MVEMVVGCKATVRGTARAHRHGIADPRVVAESGAAIGHYEDDQSTFWSALEVHS